MPRRARTISLVLVTLVAGCVTEIGSREDAGASVADAGEHDRDARGSDAGFADLDGGIALDAFVADAGLDAGPTDTGPRGPRLYPYETRHSPIDHEIADGLRAIAIAHPDREAALFAKVGDSITVSTAFLACFTGGTVDLDGRDALRTTIDHFRVGDAGGTDPFRRVSLAAGVGWSASRALMGAPSPLDQELAALRPRFASLMYGTNDVGFVDVDAFGRNMTSLLDTMLAQGTVPILSSIPPRDDDAAADRRVPLFNGIVRALAQSRGVPFVDLHRELLPLPAHGLAGDGIHPQASMGGCVLTDAGLRAGSNVRNLLVLEALDRLRRVIVDDARELEPSAHHLAGAGTRDDPYVVASLPLAAHLDTRTMGEDAVDRWDGCSTADESGREVRFRVHLDAATRVTAVVSSGTGADLDVHVVPAASTGACVARDNRQIDVDLAPGDYDLVIDTFASASGPLAGEGLVVLVPR
jgi:hypothetical protein